MAVKRPQFLDVRMAAVILTVVAAGAGLWRSRVSDIDRCQGVFQRLVAGSFSAQSRIHREHLTALDVDVGATYRGLPNERERRGYREAFIANFSKGFERTEARAGQFVRWRVAQRTPEAVTVAADYPAKKMTLLLIVPAHGKKRLQGIQWKK